MSATIKYKGNTIATASNNTKTLLTAGKYMEANVVVTDNGGGGSPTLQTKSVTYTPSASQQTDTVTADPGYDGLDEVDVTVNAVSAGSATTPATTITANPTISISGNSVSASVSKTQSITPTVSAGYVSSGTAGTVTVSGSGSATIPSASAPYIDDAGVGSDGSITVDMEIDTDGYIQSGTYPLSLNNAVSVQAAQTIYPSSSDQSISSGKYLTGAQTIKGVTYSGLDASNIKKDVVVKIGDSSDDDRILSVTGTYEGGGGGGDFLDPSYPSGVVNSTYSGLLPYGIVANRTGITTINAPNVTNMEGGAFIRCKASHIYVPKSNISSYATSVFSDCSNLEVIALPSVTRAMYGNAFQNCPKLTAVDLPACPGLSQNNHFTNDTLLTMIVLRNTSVVSLGNVGSFANTPFKSGGSGGTIYIPKSLYDHLGDGTSSDYKAATNWSTVNGYGTITWKSIESTHTDPNAPIDLTLYYADGTTIPTS